MHPLAVLPYRALAAAAQAATAFVSPAAEGKLARAFGERRDAARHFTAWARAHRDPSRPLLWMHAPSVGEGLMARPILEHARRVDARMQLAYSWFSPSAARFGAALAVDVAGMLPFDTAGNADAMLDALRPATLAFSRADVWPMLAERASARGVPLALVSAALTEGSSRGLWSRWVLADAYAALDAVGAVEASDAERLVALGVHADRITVTGDTRYDQVLARAALADVTGPLLAPLVSGADERPWVVAGSTWPADEAPLLRAWANRARAGSGARLMIAPHEPTEAHCAPIVAWAAGAGLRLARLGAPDAAAADVVLIDRVGVLGDLYAIAHVAYVGGGFHDAGLHSVVEPASFGVPVLVGPQHARSRDALRLIEARGAVAAPDGEALGAALEAWLRDDAARDAAGAAARAVVEAGRGATAKSWALLAPLLARGARTP
jgi:3-deoxy-D-manno-octulosonic-acid transferase